MAKQWTPPSDAAVTENNKFVPPSDAAEVKKKEVSQSTLDQSNTSSARLNKTTTKPTVSSSLKDNGQYTFPGQEGVSFKKEGNNWYRREKDSYEYKQIKEPARINNLEKRALSEEKYSFETAPAPKQEKAKFQAAPKAAPAKPVTQTEKAAQKAFTEEFKPLALDSPEYLKRKKESESIESKVNQITPDLINDNEGDVVPRIKDLIKDYPYLSVSESGMGYDELEIVNNATGEREKINLENWTSDRDQKEAKRLQGFLDIQMNSKDYVDQYKKVNYIKSQMSDATPTDRIKLSEQLLEEQGKLNELKTSRYLKAGDDQYKLAALYDKNAKENIKTDFAKLQIQTIDYSEKVKSYSDWTEKINEARKAGKITDEQYQTEYAPKLAEEKRMLIEEKDKISKDFAQTRSESDSIDNIAANQYAIESERGNILTGASFSALQGAENSLRFLLETGDFQDGEFKGLLTEAAPGSISETYTSAEGRNSLEQIVFGLANSGGSALVGAAIGSPFLGLYASSYVNMKDQMSSPAFKDVPEWQKILMSGVYGGTVGVLEKYGVSKWFQKTPAGKGLTNWILKKTISELGEDASSEAIELAIKKNLNAAVANGLIQITSAGLVEGSTELAQEGADMIYKDVFNKLSEKKYFENPKSWAGVADRLSQSFILGFAGGAGMNSISQATEIGRNELTKAQIDNITQFINDPELQDTFKMNLKDQILSGQITKDDAKRQVERLNELEGTIKKIPENVDRYQAFKLLNERDDIQKEIAGKDPALVAAQTERINAINEELKTISQNAVQEQTTSEVPIQPGAEVGGEVAKEESKAGSQVIAEENQKVEIGGTIRGHETISGDFQLGDVRNLLPEQNNGNVVIEGLEGDKFAVAFSRKGADGKNIFEQGTTTPRPGYISASVKIAENATPEQVQAAQQEAQRNLDLILPTVVDGVINAQAVNDVMAQQPTVEPSGKTGQLTTVEDEQVAAYRAEEQAELLKAIPKIESYKVNGEIDKTLMPKTVLAKYNKIYDKYDKLISPLLETIEQKKNLVNSQKETNLAPDEKGKQKAGNRLFNEPLKAVAEIANRYHERIFGSKRPKYEGTTELNTERSKRIAAAFEAMKHEPNNPEVRKAYEAMAKETIDQYQDFLDAGYVVEINNEEPYANSADMIEDLRKNKRIKIFSTESGFGDDPITPEQRAENPLLATTEFTDVNGQPMLVNDLFRAVHDFFGHAELGNSFGPKGEENAWNVHSRMYSPLARRAMTTETRGQNSWVNFSGFNDEIQKLRDKAAKLRDEGKIDEAAEVVGEIYDKFKFADQKIGLLPIEFSEVDQDIEDVLQADTKDATNLQKVLDALDKIEGDLDQFGKETLGVNIPVVLAKAIVKAVKALVKAGITLEQAIKQVAAENGLNDRDVKSLFNPTKVSEIDVNEVRSKARPGKRVSKGLSVKTVAGKKVVEETEDLSLEYVKQNAPKAFISNANIIAKFPLVAGKQKFKEATTVEQAQEIYDLFVREVADNLNYLMDEFKPEFREISTLWYDGANAIANDFAEQFDVSPEQAAGIIAAMSPQKDWYQNVRMAELVMMAYKDNPVMTQEMIDYQKGINNTNLSDGIVAKNLKKAEKAYKLSRTKANKEALDQAKVKMQKAINKADAVIKLLEQYLGQNLKDVPANIQPYMVRTYHEVNTTKNYNIVAPDGSVQGVAKNADGQLSKLAWGSYTEIGKAVAIYNDGSQENITRSLGEMHKIRNFYNNIIDPMSADGDVTMDTHAIAAALLLPLSGNSTQVGQNFGTGTSNSGPFGIKGLYYAYAEAYALAAKEAGLLPRQVQSITWEAVRGLYTDTFKRDEVEVAKINNIWKNYEDGKITISEAREQAKESAGGIQDPTWAGGPLQDELGESVRQEGIGSGSEGDGRDIVGGELGGEILTADTKDKTVLKKALDVLNKADQDLGKFGRETLGINIPVATMRAIIKAAKVLVKTGITLQEAIIKAAEQLNVSKEDALNAVKFMSETIKSPVKKVLVNEAAALKDQLRLEARAAREAKTDLNTKRKQIAAFIRSLETKGTITARQAAALVKRVSSLNLDNETMIERFEQYAEKVFKRAEYQDLLTSAFKVRRLIRKAIKSENQAEVVGMAKLFSKIDPSLVDDIDNYIELANSVLNAVRPSKQNVKDPALRQAVDIATIAEYATTEIAKQEENRKRELMSEYKYLVDSGVLTEDLSVKEMQEIINLIDNPTAQFDPEADQKKINFLQNRLASMEAVFRYMMANNINPFTGEEVVIEAKDADLIKRLLKMDLTEMSVKDAAKVVEAMDNYLMNNITSGLEAAVRSYEGAQNAKQLVAQGKKARPLRSYFNKTIGRFFGEQMISLPLLFEKMFPGIKNSANIMQKMGLVDVINGSNKAIRQQNDLMTEYSKEDFYKEDGFMEAKNVYERGMLAFLKRNLTGTKTEIRDEFKRRAEIIKQSIESLRENGTDKEIEMADLYQEIYDKLGVAELDLDVIEARSSKMNKDAVAWIVNQWGKYYGELADVSLSVYNSMLGSDTNYTPDRYKSLSAEDQGLDEALLNSGSGFMMSMDYTDKNKTGVLMEATRPKVLPKGRYISLDFDVNNFNSLKGALVDINTAAAIRQVDGFVKSKAFNKLIPDANDRKILTKRINTYIQRAKGKRTVTTDTIKDVERLANFITGLGVGKALAGLDQPIKQTVPVMINTMINSGGTMTFVTLDMNEAINRSGMPIANRGLESQTAVESIDRLLDKTGGRGAEAIKKLEDLNQFWLKTLLAKPDVWVARSSFITYYLKDMKAKGENVKDIDWSTHEWNKDSAQYAQLMVDRQQNISDEKLAGDFLSSDDPTKRIARKVIMPFATFIMNQKARMHNDFLALRSKDTSIEDRKSAIKSLTGLGAELFAYQLIAYGVKTLIYDNIANYLVGDDDEEEKKDKSLFGLKMTAKQYSATKFPVKSIVGDILSPLPIFDDLITMGFDKAMESFPQISNEDIKKSVDEKNTILRLQGKDEMDDNAKAKFIEQLKADNIYSVAFKNDSQAGRAYGMIGIAYDTYKELIDLSRMAYTGEFEDEYQGRVTNKYLPEEDRKILQNISVPLMIAYSTGLLPKDLGTVARKVTNIVKKKGVTENQHEKEKEVKKQIKRDLSSWEFELVKTRKKANGVVDEINYVESKGGLNDKQGKEYVKLMDAFPTPSDDMLIDIQKGMTADQIIKKNKG